MTLIATGIPAGEAAGEAEKEATGAEVGVEEGVEVGVMKEAKECLCIKTEMENKCQDINANERRWDGEDRDGGDGAGTGVEKTLSDQCQGNNKHQHQHHNNTSHHYLQIKHRHKQTNGDEAAYRLVPPDGGWGWMVALGTFIITSLLPMLAPCFGVLFSEYLIASGSSSTTTAWIFNVQCLLWNIIALLTRPLTLEFGWRAVAMVGSTMAATGIMISAFTPSPYFLFFSFSVLTGLGGGMVTFQCFTILPHYFDRRRGLVNGIMMSGICMGPLVGSPVSRFLQDSYGFRGATLILGALLLNACIGASFFHPYEWHQKKVLLGKDPHEDTSAMYTNDKAAKTPALTNGIVHSNTDVSFKSSAAEGETGDNLVVRARLLTRLGIRRESCSSSRSSSRYNSTLSLSSLDVGGLGVLQMEEEPLDKDARKGQRGILPVRVVRSLIKDLKAVKSLRVGILCLGATMIINGHYNFTMMVPFAMLDAGFSLDTSAWCISVSAGCNMIMRIVVSALSDWPRFNSSLVYMLAFAIIASATFAFTLVSTVEGMMMSTAAFGIGVGSSMGLLNIVIMDVMGVENLAPVFATICFIIAFGFLCTGPFIGFIRDVTQSYAVSIRIISGMMLVGLSAWLFMGLAKKVDRRREERRKLKEALQI